MPDSTLRLLEAFPGLTAKQHEVLRFVAENRTSKEIAWELGISESAVNQRIEGVRSRTGSPPRAELARAYRLYQQDGAADEDAAGDATCKPLPGKIPQVPAGTGAGQPWPRDDRARTRSPIDAATYGFAASWQREREGRVVPEVLDGAHAGLSRTAAMIAIAVGILLAGLVGLSVVETLSNLI
ncbi:LuxR family transcriptional regulator [Novosphingobium malaysiense]|uniref:LuxR family transcriptional regulator n=1 Tax=Novosphingobium malaysiense TaxID=1348853 RepID=A0A0B1ZRY4_9SPHN|nr:LuxR family transcriptional regulator [Novosphingobium malaysiense]